MTKKYFIIKLTSNFLIYEKQIYQEVNDEEDLYDITRNKVREWIKEWLYNNECIPSTTRIELNSYSDDNKIRGEISLVIIGAPGYVHIGCYNCTEITRDDYIEGLLL